MIEEGRTLEIHSISSCSFGTTIYNVVTMLGQFWCCYPRKACDLMLNFHLILSKFCEYVIYILLYNMHKEREFPMKIKNLAALFRVLFEY